MNQNQINITFPDTSTEKSQPKPFDPIAALTPKPFEPIAALTPQQPKPFDPIAALTPQQQKIQTHHSIHPPPAKPTQVISNIDTLPETSEEKPTVHAQKPPAKPTQIVSNIDTLTETSEEKPKKTFRASETPDPTASEKKGGSYKKYLKYKLKYLYALKEFYNTNI
jgi:hypothetical protein